MLRNNILVAFRNLWRNKVFSLINISGLAIGISAALVIYLVVEFQFSFEKFRKDGDRIYRVVSDMSFPGGEIFKNSGVPMPMANAVRSDLTGIETVTHFVVEYQLKVTVPAAGKEVPVVFKKQTGIVYADEYYFSMLDYDWIAGPGPAALKDPFRVVLTEDRAKVYFGNMNPADIPGQTILYNDTIPVIVSGIVKDPVEKATCFRFREFISLSTVMSTRLKDDFGGDEWTSINSASQLFVKLKPGVEPEQLNRQFAGLRKKFNKDNKESSEGTRNHLQPLSDLHFNPDYDSFEQPQAHKPILYGLLAVASFLLLLGGINFINLTTAQSARRAKEIGIRKTLGSSKAELVFQFLSETFLLTLMATVLSIVIMPWLLKIFSDFIPPEITFASIDQLHVWVFLAALVLMMTLLSGFYPALVLTRFKPVSVLKNQLREGSARSRSAWFRKTLTVTQFVIAQFLVIATLMVGRQINFSMNKDLGYAKEAIVYIHTPQDYHAVQEDHRRLVLSDKIRAIPGIDQVSLGGMPPASTSTSTTSMKVNNGKKTVELMVDILYADPGYFSIYKMRCVAGRFPAPSDTTREYLVNETFAREVGFANPAEAIGKSVELYHKTVPVAGVLADFHAKSTHAPIKPLAYSSERRSSYTIHLKLKSREGDPELWNRTLASVEKEYKALYPEHEFKYEFFSDTIAAFYKGEQNISRLLTWASGLCIFISCLGLLGLVIYTTNVRTKEIGVRKVLGASVVQIVTLLSKDLLLLVLVAFTIASPLAWLAMDHWLQDFAYRTRIDGWLFALAGLAMLLIALPTVSYQSVKAAMANPVKSLRTE